MLKGNKFSANSMPYKVNETLPLPKDAPLIHAGPKGQIPKMNYTYEDRAMGGPANETPFKLPTSLGEVNNENLNKTVKKVSLNGGRILG
jgi:hypothetical protein